MIPKIPEIMFMKVFSIVRPGNIKNSKIKKETKTIKIGSMTFFVNNLFIIFFMTYFLMNIFVFAMGKRKTGICFSVSSD
jgi:hypothetical protein